MSDSQIRTAGGFWDCLNWATGTAEYSTARKIVEYAKNELTGNNGKSAYFGEETNCVPALVNALRKEIDYSAYQRLQKPVKQSFREEVVKNFKLPKQNQKQDLDLLQTKVNEAVWTAWTTVNGREELGINNK